MIQFKLNSTKSYLIYQVGRFGTSVLVNIILAKSYLSVNELGQFEMFLFYASAISFFWITGISQGFLSIYNKKSEISPENNTLGFNTFLIVFGLSFFISIFLGFGSFFGESNFLSDMPKDSLFLLSAYMLIYPSGFLIEYLLLLNHKYKSLVKYAVLSSILTIFVVAVPSHFNFSIETCLYSLIFVAALKLIYLLKLLNSFSSFKLRFNEMQEIIRISLPLIGSALLAGSASYIDSVIVSVNCDAGTFAIFRYGAREFPLFLLVASAVETSILPLFSKKENLIENLQLIKRKSKENIRYLFPLAILFMAISQYIFQYVFNQSFYESYYIFDIYLLLIISRFVYPSTILMGLMKNNIILIISLIELAINIIASLVLFWLLGYPGVAYGTVIAFFSEKLMLSIYVKRKLKIKFSDFIPIFQLTIFSCILIMVFILKIWIYSN